MYSPSSENKGADQLRSYCEADLRLCFRIGNNPVFSRCGSNIPHNNFFGIFVEFRQHFSKVSYWAKCPFGEVLFRQSGFRRGVLLFTFYSQFYSKTMSTMTVIGMFDNYLCSIPAIYKCLLIAGDLLPSFDDRLISLWVNKCARA